jgi:Holliday junction resolvase-like predicted endonuclease|tara:strand:+ start:231 stop:545 length:315 start_codon:yes stop_codon:yes gene_type:complete
MDSKHRKGYVCELIAEKYLTDKGLYVFKNSSGLGPIDLITYNDETKKIQLIDVKYESLRLTGKKAGTRINRVKSPRQVGISINADVDLLYVNDKTGECRTSNET